MWLEDAGVGAHETETAKLPLALLAIAIGLIGFAGAYLVYAKEKAKAIEPAILADAWGYDRAVSNFKGGPGRIPQEEFDRVAACFVDPDYLPAEEAGAELTALREHIEDLPVLEAAYLAVEAVEALVEDCGITKTLEDFGVSQDDFPEMAKVAMTVARPLANNPRKVTPEDAVEIYNGAF